jgi:predicted nucleic acid-binding protein
MAQAEWLAAEDRPEAALDLIGTLPAPHTAALRLELGLRVRLAQWEPAARLIDRLAGRNALSAADRDQFERHVASEGLKALSIDAATAREAWSRLPERLRADRVVALTAARLLVQHSLMGADVMSLAQAWTVYQKWMAAPGVDLLPDPPGLESAIARVLAAQTLPARRWTDLCLAATAQAAGLRLVSFDRDFGRLNLERCLVLQAPSDLGSGPI